MLKGLGKCNLCETITLTFEELNLSSPAKIGPLFSNINQDNLPDLVLYQQNKLLY